MIYFIPTGILCLFILSCNVTAGLMCAVSERSEMINCKEFWVAQYTREAMGFDCT